MNKNTIGKFIAELRREAGFTQKELGEKLSVSYKTVSRWECDETLPDLSLIPVIAEVFGVTADELLRGERKVAASDEIFQKENAGTKSEAATKPEATEKNTQAVSKRGERELMRMITVAKTKHTLRAINSLAISALGFLIAYVIAVVSPGSIRETWWLAVITALMIDIFAIYFLVTGTVNALLSLDGDGFEEKKQIKERIGDARREAVKRTLWYASYIVLAFVLTVTWLHLGDIVEFLICSLIFTPLTALGCCIVAVIIWDHLKRKGTIE